MSPPPKADPFPHPCSETLLGQYDGNVTFESVNDLEILSDQNEQKIPTQVGFRPSKIIHERPLRSRKRIVHDNKQIQALSLPTLTCYNMRSLFGKILSLSQDIIERESDLIFLTEVWEKAENKGHQQKLEAMLETKGIKYISTPRPGRKRGGGAALAVRLENFTISKLNISCPRSSEVVWGILRPKVPIGRISTIISCCFYSPPHAPEKMLPWLTTSL